MLHESGYVAQQLHKKLSRPVGQVACKVKFRRASPNNRELVHEAMKVSSKPSVEYVIRTLMGSRKKLVTWETD